MIHFLKNTTQFLIILLLFISCTTPPAMLEESTNKRMVLYQMMTRLFTNTNLTNKPWGTIEENGVGKMNQINTPILDNLKSQGYTHIWFTGVLEHAILTDYTAFGIPLDDADVVKGRAGSPYAIKDYYDINPDLAEDVPNRIREFELLIKRTHDAGLKVVIDFVPNHVARAYRSDAKPEGVIDLGAQDDKEKAFVPNNNFYYIPNSSFSVPNDYKSLGDNTFPTKDGLFNEVPAKVSGNDVFNATPSIYDWFETVKLNYGVDYQDNRKTYFEPIPDTWLKMRDIIEYWASKGVDAFRCDMAEMVPVEFWQWMTNEVKKTYPDLVFIAEIYNPNAYRDYIFKGGFDYLYDKVELYDTLKSIIQNRATTDDLTVIWQRQEGIDSNMLRFLENHDEQRIASPYFAGNSQRGIPMMAASAFMHKGPVMMYFGQDVGEPGSGESGFSGDDGRTTIFDYWTAPEHAKWVNNGKFDGGQLSEDQKRLQRKYIDINKSINEKEAIRAGDFYDLHYYNRNSDYTGYSNQVYCFVRHTANEVLLIVINFSTKKETAFVKVPDEAWKSFGLQTELINASNQYINFDFKKSTTVSYGDESGLGFNILPNDYMIITLIEKK